MENQAPQSYDMLAIDAFSSDAVPIHLLTKQAMAVYLKHLKDDGILAFHVSNLHLDLEHVVMRLASEYKLSASWMVSAENTNKAVLDADWVLLSRDKGILKDRRIEKHAGSFNPKDSGIRLWTDDYANLFEILK